MNKIEVKKEEKFTLKIGETEHIVTEVELHILYDSIGKLLNKKQYNVLQYPPGVKSPKFIPTDENSKAWPFDRDPNRITIQYHGDQHPWSDFYVDKNDPRLFAPNPTGEPFAEKQVTTGDPVYKHPTFYCDNSAPK